ncbi:hypothetical protein JCM33374_g2773 [Metschnikowia sp. JCM 33374]|nr:hypothetical protein JCM33374_g2773 [Metschnikowia sp. JCM 33374]
MLKFVPLPRIHSRRVPVHLQCAIFHPSRLIRRYSIKPPIYKKSGNMLASALKYVKDVEEYQEELSMSSSESNLADELLSRISDQPELLFLLSLFHSELSKIGITATSSRQFTTAQVWKYRALYVMKLANIHNIFWTQCQYQNISEREHSLGFSPDKIGILDPVHFGKDAYEQIQQGVYNGTSFKDIEVLGIGKFK